MVGAVPAATQAGLKHSPLDARVPKAHEGEGRQLLERGGVAEGLDGRPDDAHRVDDRLLADERAVDADALAEAVKMRARVQADRHATRSEHLLAERRRGPLAIGACNVDAFERAERLVDADEQSLKAIPILLRILVPLGQAVVVSVGKRIPDGLSVLRVRDEQL